MIPPPFYFFCILKFSFVIFPYFLRVCSYLFPFLRVCSNLPLSSTCRLTLSPTSGDSLLPVIRGRLFCVSHFIIFYFYLYKTIISFFLSRSLPPNTEGSAEPCEAIGASLRTQVRIVLLCLLTLASSDGSAATLAKAKRLTHFYSVALLPGKWFACFPTSRDSLRTCIHRSEY